MPLKREKKFKYKPISLKEILIEMKQDIDLMIDLAFSAIKFGSKEIADEVYTIEQRIHELILLLNLQIIQSQFGGLKEAQTLQPIIVIGYSIDKISDALSDIAKVVYINNNITEFTQLMWDIVPEPIVKITINQGCEFVGQFREDIHIRSKYGVDLIAIKRGTKWIFSKDEKVFLNDILIVKGEKDSIMEFKKKCFDLKPISFKLDNEEKKSPFNLKKLETTEHLIYLRKLYVQITDISETMIELALAALYFNNLELAEDVLGLEELVSGLNVNFEKEVLEFTKHVDLPKDLTGILRIAFSCEVIASAAAHIAEIIVKGFEPHRILQKAITETSEIAVREVISENSYFKEKTYKELQESKYKQGFHIIALKRNDQWIYSFKPDFIFKEGDLLIGLGPKETVTEWRQGVNPEYFMKEDF